MTLTPQWLDELRARTSLSTLIGKTVKVQKAGREYKACCPFHNEKSPSFTVSEENRTFPLITGSICARFSLCYRFFVSVKINFNTFLDAEGSALKVPPSSKFSSARF